MGAQPGRVLGRDDPLVGRLVGERRAGDEVADRVHPGAAGAQRTVHPHEPPLVELHAGIGEAERLDVSAAPGADDDVVDLGRHPQP